MECAAGLTLEHWVEPAISKEDDASLRGLLAVSFTKPGDEIFVSRRWAHDPPSDRWVLRTKDGLLGAHAAVRVRPVTFDESERASIGGVSEVCVHPALRRRGLVRILLEAVHAHLEELDVAWAVLFGDLAVYRSSGYVPATNELRFWDPRTLVWRTEAVPSLLVRTLGAVRFPGGQVDFHGVLF